MADYFILTTIKDYLKGTGQFAMVEISTDPAIFILFQRVIGAALINSNSSITVKGLAVVIFMKALLSRWFVAVFIGRAVFGYMIRYLVNRTGYMFP